MDTLPQLLCETEINSKGRPGLISAVLTFASQPQVSDVSSSSTIKFPTGIGPFNKIPSRKGLWKC